jgi:class 3 adenylate cyclase
MHDMAGDADSNTTLAAIMFTDIVGYSRLMEEDEQRTIGLLEQHNAIVLPLVEAAGGEVIDAIGDGLFILFPSVRDTITCAGSIADAIGAHNHGSSPAEQFHLRIGIHLGEIWRRNDRVFGNGVNVAARVQPFAKPGGICVTEDVYRQIANRPEIKTEHIGHHQLHNISRTFDLYHVITGHEAEVEHPGAEVTSELDVVKERILRERQKIGEKLAKTSGGDTDPDSRIESKIYKLVDHAMDKALEKWESLPEEKKTEALKELGKQARTAKESGITVELGKEPKTDGDSSLVPGLAMGIGFGLGYFYFGIGWMIWPLIFAGILPFTLGLLKHVRTAIKRRHLRLERPEKLQRYMLSLAKEQGGQLTVVQVASLGQVSLQEAQETLDRMAAKGYVVQQMGDDGTITYEFPGILPSGSSASSL